MIPASRRPSFRQALRQADFADIMRDSEITPTYAAMVVKDLRFLQQMTLAEHAPGYRACTASRQETMTSQRLIELGLIRYRSPEDHSITLPTEKGRAVIAYLLGRWADVLAQIDNEREAPTDS